MIPHSKPCITKDDKQAVMSVLDSHLLDYGAKAKEFESNLCEYLGVSSAYLTRSGSHALALILNALNIKEGDEVITPLYVCAEVRNTIQACGAKIVYCDIGEGWTITADTVAKVVTAKTKAIIVIHAMGMIVEDNKLLDFGVTIIDDFCQCLCPIEYAAASRGERISFYSFGSTKCISAGGGGAIASDNEAFISALQNRNHFDNKPLNDLSWVLASSQLSQYPKFLASRKHILESYIDLLPESSVARFREHSSISFFFRLPITIAQDYEALESAFKAYGVSVRKPVALEKTAIDIMKQNKLENTHLRWRETLSLPLYPALTKVELNSIHQAIEHNF